MGRHHGDLPAAIARGQVRAREGEDGGVPEGVWDGELDYAFPLSLFLP